MALQGVVSFLMPVLLLLFSVAHSLLDITGVAGLWRRAQQQRKVLQLVSLWPALACCSPAQLRAAAEWMQTATEDDPLLILLQPHPEVVAALAAPLPQGLGPNPMNAVRQALVQNGARAHLRCPESCFSFADMDALVQVSCVRNQSLSARSSALLHMLIADCR